MFTSTPERATLPYVDRILPSASKGMQLPPLASLLKDQDTPFRPHLPAINTMATPSTPRYMFPSFSGPSTGSSTGAQTFQRHSIATDGMSRRASAGNTSVDSDADTSAINDSMIKPATKRKAAVSPTRDFAFISHSPATYPSQEPSIDNASLARRKRRRTSPNELAVLNQEFVLGSTPDKNRRVDIAKKVNMTEKAVQIWFQNKRQSLRRLKCTDKEITELPPTPDSSAVPSRVSTDATTTPIIESTPIRPSLVKSQSQVACDAPMIAQSSPIRSYSTPDVHSVGRAKDTGSKGSLLSKILATKDEKKESPELVMNLTNKKQPEFARSSSVSTLVMTFKLTPKERKPLGAVDTNTLHTPRGNSSKDTQCIQSLLSLKVANR